MSAPLLNVPGPGDPNRIGPLRVTAVVAAHTGTPWRVAFGGPKVTVYTRQTGLLASPRASVATHW